MKKIFRTIICLVCCYVIAICLTACSDQDAPSIDTNEVKVQLTGLNDDLSGLDVQLRNINTGSVFIEQTNAPSTTAITAHQDRLPFLQAVPLQPPFL